MHYKEDKMFLNHRHLLPNSLHDEKAPAVETRRILINMLFICNKTNDLFVKVHVTDKT